MTVLVIARLTIHEAARRRILWVLVGLTALSVALTAWGVDRLVAIAGEHGASGVELQVGVSQVLILVAFMFSFVLAMTAAFLGAPAVAADVESGVAHAMLARPIRRGELVVGRWLGLALVVVVYATASGLLEIGAIQLVSGQTPPDPIGAVGFLAAQAVVLLTLALLLSTRIPAIAAGAIAVVAFGLAWMFGVLAGIGAVFDAQVLVTAADVSRYVLPTDALWRGTVFALEPPLAVLIAAGIGRAAAGNPFLALEPPAAGVVAWSAIWIAVALALAVLSFRRRDL